MLTRTAFRATLTTPVLLFALGLLEAADSGRLPWIVEKVRHADLSGQSDVIVADFATEAEAVARANELNQKNRDLAIYYGVRSRETAPIDPREKGLTGYHKGIRDAYARATRASTYLKNFTGEMSRKTFNEINATIRDFNNDVTIGKANGEVSADVVRVAPITEDEFKGTLVDDDVPLGASWSLKGRTGVGTVRDDAGNQWEMAFEFRDDGSFVARSDGPDGKVIGTGTWNQAAFAVSIRTDRFVYEGTVGPKEDLTVKGRRRPAGSQQARGGEWVMDFSGKKPAGGGKPVGKWTKSYVGNQAIGGYGYFEVLDIRPDGVMYLEWGDTGPIAKPTKRYIGAKGTFRWKIEGSKIVFEQVTMDEGTWQKRFERELDDLVKEYKK